jgi:pyridoxine 5-phosphate synthase
MTRLSVNINKIATIRNARGGNTPNVAKAALDCQKYGAEGITVHPRPDERHIRYSDVREIKKIINVEFNIEGYPNESFLKLVEEIKPTQVTLVPDPPNVLTSNAGWNTRKNESFLKEIISRLKESKIRTSVFVDTDLENIYGALEVATDRIELYTEFYAENYHKDKIAAIEEFKKAACVAYEIGLGLNAGHDLSLDNLEFFNKEIRMLDEVSIGHALISDSLYYGLENTIQMYKRLLK